MLVQNSFYPSKRRVDGWLAKSLTWQFIAHGNGIWKQKCKGIIKLHLFTFISNVSNMQFSTLNEFSGSLCPCDVVVYLFVTMRILVFGSPLKPATTQLSRLVSLVCCWWLVDYHFGLMWSSLWCSTLYESQVPCYSEKWKRGVLLFLIIREV